MTDKKTLQQQFRSSIRRGTGEAHLILQRHPAIDFSADIIKAALWNYAYDAQSEGSRAIYIAELMALSKHQDKIRNAILTGLATEEKDTWALVQLFDLAKILAQKGDQEARQAIYHRFYTKIIAGSDWCGYTDIAKSKYLKTDRLLEFASGALKFFTGPDIRQFAIDKLSQTKAPYRYLDLR